MSLKIPLPVCSVWTMRTLKWFFPCMCKMMAPKVSLAAELLTALMTWVTFLLHISSFHRPPTRGYKMHANHTLEQQPPSLNHKISESENKTTLRFNNSKLLST